MISTFPLGVSNVMFEFAYRAVYFPSGLAAVLNCRPRLGAPCTRRPSPGSAPDGVSFGVSDKARVEISIRARKLRLRLNGKIVMIMRTVVGKRSTPTPKGNFAIYERAPSEKGSNIGPFALHLTAFSNVLRSYDGGPGRIAIHGRSGSLLYDPLGSARSHGCVRISNSPLKRLAKFAKPGTPVSIAFGWPKLPAS